LQLSGTSSTGRRFNDTRSRIAWLKGLPRRLQGRHSKGRKCPN
jgi:hypothetical protein